MNSDALAGRSVAGWRIVRLLGSGAHGEVYLAERSGAPGPVALKLVALDASSGLQAAQQAFLRGAAVARGLQHPNIVALYDAGVEAATGWLAMEAVPGGELGRYTAASRLLPVPVVLGLARRLAQALAHAHRQGVIHRDFKPGNVLVHWPTDTVKLADFGLARGADAARTGTGIVPGTPAYMAPEQLAGSAPTPASDFYSFGVTLFQLLAGRLPHEGSTMGELLREVASVPAPDLHRLQPEVAPELAAWVARLLDKRPAARPADGERLAAELLELARRLPGGG